MIERLGGHNPCVQCFAKDVLASLRGQLAHQVDVEVILERIEGTMEAFSEGPPWTHEQVHCEAVDHCVDVGIADAVTAFTKRGLTTTMSCQGGLRVIPIPYVIVRWDDEAEKRLRGWIDLDEFAQIREEPMSYQDGKAMRLDFTNETMRKLIATA